MNGDLRVSAVLTCFNRRATTLECLRRLQAQKAPGLSIDVVLVDDGSTDGTAEAVRATYPRAVVLEGPGDLFWARGMRMAMEEAVRARPDVVLWLNDDTMLDPGALATLHDTARQLEARRVSDAVIVGCTRDPDTGAHTYGGRYRPSRLRRHHFALVPVAPEPQRVETMNGNVVWIPRAVYENVGLIRPYAHSFGDEDYGLRVREAGGTVWTAPGTVATCARNPAPVYGRKPLLEEIRALWSRKGLDITDWVMFQRRWGGPLWPLYVITPYLRRSAHVVKAHLRHRPDGRS